MRFAFWRTRNRFSLEELRYLTEQLQRVPSVNDYNKDYVVEALRSIAEIVTYGDQHDPTFFEFFMEKQVMAEFTRILKVSKTATVPLQLLQTMSIMIQNLKSEHAIYYIFSNEHINYLITYPFDFDIEELLSYYISFLRAISGKLNKKTISLLIKTQNDEIVSFPLYTEAIRFAFHEENMVRIAVRALTLNIYHVGDEFVNRYVTSSPLEEYFSKLVTHFRKQCIKLDQLVVEAAKNPGLSDQTSSILSAVDEIEDTLYYFSDVISSGVPNLGRLITDNILQLLVFSLLLPSLGRASYGIQISASTSLYLICCILRILKTKDLASSICAALFCHPEALILNRESKLNGSISDQGLPSENEEVDHDKFHVTGKGTSRITELVSSSSENYSIEDISSQPNHNGSHFSLRDVLLSYIIHGDDIQASGALSLLATLLQTKELDESMLDALGILPQRKQHKKLLLQALVGEGSGEEQLFSGASSPAKDSISNELEAYLQKLENHYGLTCLRELAVNPQVRRHQVLDALASLLCRSGISAETLWDGGWLVRQLLPHSEDEFNSHQLKLLRKNSLRKASALHLIIYENSLEESHKEMDSYNDHINGLVGEIKGTWCDVLITVIMDEWKWCKRAIESSSPQKDPKCLLLPRRMFSYEGGFSFKAGERMYEIVKGLVVDAIILSWAHLSGPDPLQSVALAIGILQFWSMHRGPCEASVFHYQLRIICRGGTLPDQPPVSSPLNPPVMSRAKNAGLDALVPKPGTEINLVDGESCRIAFERGKERHFCFLAISRGTSGWVLLIEDLPHKPNFGVVRVAAPLAGSNPRIDDKHPKWLHLCIRPSTLPFLEASKQGILPRMKGKGLIDGRWTLAFKDEVSCKSAESMIREEMDLQCIEVEKRLRPFLDSWPVQSVDSSWPDSEVEKKAMPLLKVDRPVHSIDPSNLITEAS